MPRMILLLVEVIVFAVLLATTSCHFGLVDGMKITAAYLVAYIIPRTILNHAHGNSTSARVILCLLTILMMRSLDAASKPAELLLQLLTAFDIHDKIASHVDHDMSIFRKEFHLGLHITLQICKAIDNLTDRFLCF